MTTWPLCTLKPIDKAVTGGEVYSVDFQVHRMGGLNVFNIWINQTLLDLRSSSVQQGGEEATLAEVQPALGGWRGVELGAWLDGLPNTDTDDLILMKSFLRRAKSRLLIITRCYLYVVPTHVDQPMSYAPTRVTALHVKITEFVSGVCNSGYTGRMYTTTQ